MKNTETQDALEMLGAGYEHPSLEIHPPQTIIRRRGKNMEEEVIPAFVKISTAFKKELAVISGDALKVWVFIALSINRNTEDAHPGVRTIAKACKVGINQVTAHVKQLEEMGLLTVNREDRKYNIYKIPDYVSANTVTPQVTDTQTVTFESKTVTPKHKTVTPTSDLTREPDINQNTQVSKITNYSLLKKVEEDWKIGMMMLSTPWESNKKGWQSFPRWLMEQEQKGYSVKTFCKWFMSDPFRAKTIGMWSPEGRKTDGSYSFKAIYLQAFPREKTQRLEYVNGVPQIMEA